MGLGFGTDHVQSPEAHGERRAGEHSVYPDSPGLPAVGYQGWKFFLHGQESRVVAAAGS